MVNMGHLMGQSVSICLQLFTLCTVQCAAYYSELNLVPSGKIDLRPVQHGTFSAQHIVQVVKLRHCTVLSVGVLVQSSAKSAVASIYCACGVYCL